MKYFRLRVGDCAEVTIDANQADVSPIRLYDGPIESHLVDYSFGTFGPSTFLYGRVWTGGPQVVIRYYSAQAYGEDPVPICAVARLLAGQLRKLPGSVPGIAVLEFPRTDVCIVDEFR